MSEERAFQRQLVNYLIARRLQVQSHEDRLDLFIPDLSFSGCGTDGWIELKWCTRLPDKLDDIKHWTRGQEDWLIKTGVAGSGHCYLWLASMEYHALWNWQVLAGIRKLKMEDALRAAIVHGPTITNMINGLIRALDPP